MMVAEDPWPFVFSLRLYENDTFSMKIQSEYLDDIALNLILHRNV